MCYRWDDDQICYNHQLAFGPNASKDFVRNFA